MKIVHLIPNIIKGGLEEASMNYLRACVELGHDNHVVIWKKSPYVEHLYALQQGVLTPCQETGRMQKGKGLKPLVAKLSISTILNKSRSSLINFFLILKTIKSYRPDTLIIHGNSMARIARMAKKLFGCKVIKVDHGGKNIQNSRYFDVVVAANEGIEERVRNALQQGVSTPCQETVRMRKGKELKPLVAKLHISTIHNVISIKNYHLQNFTKIFPEKLTLGFMGRLDTDKGIDDLMKLLLLFKDSKIDFLYKIGGTGKREQELLNFIAANHLEKHVEMCGWIGDSEKHKFFQNLHFFTLLSPSESFGIVLIESMLFHTPIVTYPVEGPSIIDPEKGFMFFTDRKDTNEVFQIIIENWQNTKLLQDRAGLGVDAAKKYCDWEGFRSQIEVILNKRNK